MPRPPFLACWQLPLTVCSHNLFFVHVQRKGVHKTVLTGVSFSKDTNPVGSGPHPWPHFTFIISYTPYHQIQSHWGLGLPHRHLGDTNSAHSISVLVIRAKHGHQVPSPQSFVLEAPHELVTLMKNHLDWVLGVFCLLIEGYRQDGSKTLNWDIGWSYLYSLTCEYRVNGSN